MESTQKPVEESKTNGCGCSGDSFSFMDMFKMMRQMKQNKSAWDDCCSMMREMFESPKEDKDVKSAC